ncbi:hypothetical protein [Archangium sp.]|uniref:hypothetical protein n=1 Tax=Archangium sp. TaxID=1872627 RepID=UPI00286CCBBF|nr:hypothetical protein [Archangium sp.]
MPTPSKTRALLRPALLLPLLAVACDPTPPPTTPELPQVGIILDEPSTVSTSFKLGITVSGCDQVRSLELLDDNTLLKQVTYTTTPTPVELAMNEFRYTRGIATPLALSARVTCADGRTNVSQSQVATFFPVAEAISPLGTNDQVVPDYFIADGSGANVTFIGCVRESNGSGLYKVTKNPADKESRVTMEIPCTAQTVITDRKPAGTGWRWVWTPNEGLFVIDSQFRAGPVFRLAVDRVTVTPEGDALAYDDTLRRMWRISRTATTNTALWINDKTGPILGEMVFSGNGTTAVVPLGIGFGESSTSGQIQVRTLDYATGQWLGEPSVVDTLSNINPGAVPPVAFNASGTQLFITVQTGTGANLKACAISGGTPGCDGANLKWRTATPLQGSMVALVPYANGSRVAAVAAYHTWFLDAATGQVVNKGGLSISPTGALVPRQVLVGAASVFYLFNSALPQAQVPVPAPVEIVATDLAERGELFRYVIPGSSLSGSTDDAGTLWLRVGRKLVRPLTAEQYRQVRP